jgi:hypothetical protein
MKIIIFIIISLTFIIISCNNDEANDDIFNATVMGKGLDCGDSFLIKFNNVVSGLPVNNFDNTFYEINLPEEYKTEGKKIKVEFREPKNDEVMVCTTLGIGYPQIYITKVE